MTSNLMGDESMKGRNLYFRPNMTRPIYCKHSKTMTRHRLASQNRYVHFFNHVFVAHIHFTTYESVFQWLDGWIRANGNNPGWINLSFKHPVSTRHQVVRNPERTCGCDQ